MISVQSITKEFRTQSDSLSTIKNFFLPGEKNKGFRAISDISFQVNSGEVVGIIGKNGAGKSTLLQLICGTLKPTMGEIIVSGKIGALLELGAGFHPEFTGRENIYLSGATMGFSKVEIEQAASEIIEFSGIGNFVEKPVKTYSSGMLMRLAFSIATCVRPEILIIDEVLSVGDQEFSRKCLNRILELKHSGTTSLFCSHSIYQVEALCDRAIWLDHGEIKKIGDTKSVTTAYNEELLLKNIQTADAYPQNAKNKNAPVRTHFGEINFLKNGESIKNNAVFKSRIDDLSIRVCYITKDRNPTLAVSIRRANGEIVASAGSLNDGALPISPNDSDPFFEITFFKLPLLSGIYSIDLSLFCEHGIQTLDAVSNAIAIEVTQEDLEQGIVHLSHQWLDLNEK